ncbi:hypothetical protein B0H13DRAFT_1859365 [Mycena leptocephala]|nr:hypothetical protein B0H13DRAFT_1859365 [Mycena leptocephala]
MSQRRKSKNLEVRKVAQDIQEIVEGLDPAVANRWFHYKPNARSSKQQENYSPLPSPEKLPQKRKIEAVKSEPIDLSLDSDDSDCAAASSSHTAKKTKKSASPDAENLEAVEMSFCAYVETPPHVPLQSPTLQPIHEPPFPPRRPGEAEDALGFTPLASDPIQNYSVANSAAPGQAAANRLLSRLNQQTQMASPGPPIRNHSDENLTPEQILTVLRLLPAALALETGLALPRL